ncbi:hypothetical protein [Bradyrhizobium liaoningense]|nr:hypothetical protein [Bradyrhizobium liaoningense]MBR0717830.1 hypothetical protein [Bradyrhizobium liaoningense]
MALRRVDPDAALGAAASGTSPTEAPAYWVCLALLLALVALAARIASVW